MTQPSYPPPPPLQVPPQRRPKWVKWVALAVLAPLVFFVALCAYGVVGALTGAENELGREVKVVPSAEQVASSTPSNPAPSPQRFVPGDTITVETSSDAFEVTVGKPVTLTDDGFGGKAERGVMLAFEVTVAATKGEAFPSSGDFAFITADGEKLGERLFVAEGKEMLAGDTIAAGQRIHGWIMFDVPKETAGAQVEMTLLSLLSDNQRIGWHL